MLRQVAPYGDGTARIRQLADERFDARIEVVDAYHVYPAPGRPHALFNDTPDAVLTALRAKAPTPDAAAVLRRERRYFATDAERMNHSALRRTSPHLCWSRNCAAYGRVGLLSTRSSPETR
jgi:hypothetical protein